MNHVITRHNVALQAGKCVFAKVQIPMQRLVQPAQLQNSLQITAAA